MTIRAFWVLAVLAIAPAARTADPASKFARNHSYPAFHKLGNGSMEDSDLVGGISLGFDWTVLTIQADVQKLNVPPKGFRALFDGKTLANWRGQIDEDPRRIAKVTKDLSDAEIKQLQEAADQKTLAHWKAEDGLIHYDGARGVGNLETREHFGNFELYLDWKIPKGGDSGIFPRNMPQVQIWDPAGGKRNVVGSGGLDNNGPDIPPKKKADNPVGEWNTFYIKMVGDKIWVTLNGVPVIEGETKGNYWKEFKEPPPAKGPIVLQSHGSHLWFRNLFIRELD